MLLLTAIATSAWTETAWRGVIHPASTATRLRAAEIRLQQDPPPPELDEQQAAFMKARGFVWNAKTRAWAKGDPERLKKLEVRSSSRYLRWEGDQGKLPDAEARLAQSAALLEDLSKDHPDAGRYQDSLADLYKLQGRLLRDRGNLASVLPVYNQALAAADRLIAPPHAEVLALEKLRGPTCSDPLVRLPGLPRARVAGAHEASRRAGTADGARGRRGRSLPAQKRPAGHSQPR